MSKIECEHDWAPDYEWGELNQVDSFIQICLKCDARRKVKIESEIVWPPDLRVREYPHTDGGTT